MEGSGRKSTASLSVVAAIPGQRPEPPQILSAAEADVWRAVAATRQSDWFTGETFPLLEEYCRAAVSADEVATELAKFKKIPARGEKFRRFLTLRKLQDQTARLLASLATKMRLSQQSRYDKKAAHTGSTPARKPWEFGNSA